MALNRSPRSRHRSFGRRIETRARAGRGISRPMLEFLECRQLLSLTVSTFDDVVDAGDGFLSLREASSKPRGRPAPRPSSCHMNQLGGGDLRPLHGELGISDSDGVTIVSTGGAATIDAQGASRVFNIAAGSVVTAARADDYRRFAPDLNTGSGGGVWNKGSVTITDCLLKGNSAGFVGGGLFNDLAQPRLPIVNSKATRPHTAVGSATIAQ